MSYNGHYLAINGNSKCVMASSYLNGNKYNDVSIWRNNVSMAMANINNVIMAISAGNGGW